MVFGPGLLGLLMLQVARASGATTDVVVGRGPRLGIAAGLGASAELPVDMVTHDELDVLGVRSSPNAYPAMIALLASGAIRTEPLASHVYPLADVATAFDALERREAIRPILIP